MRDYAQVRPSLWTGETGRALRGNANAQRVQFYLLTCANSNIAGLFYLPLPLICHDIGIDWEGAQEGLRSLSEAGFAHYDEPSSYVWVVNAARENVGTNPNLADNRVLGVRREVERHAKSPFYQRFVEHYAALFQSPPRDTAASKARAPRKALESPSAGGGGSGSGSGAGDGSGAGGGEGAGTRVRARSVLRPIGEQTESPDAELLTAGHLASLFRETWMACDRDDPPMPDEDDLEVLAQRVNNTAALRKLPPAELFVATLEHWARTELKPIEKRAPVQCFAQAFGEVIEQVVAGAPPSSADLLSKQSNDALRAGDVERYESLQSQLRALSNGGGRHAAATR